MKRTAAWLVEPAKRSTVVVLFVGLLIVGGYAITAAQSATDNLAATSRASTRTRITTVGQRCDLTHLILGVLVRVHDTQDAAPFQASYEACLKQLATVKAINARAH